MLRTQSRHIVLLLVFATLGPGSLGGPDRLVAQELPFTNFTPESDRAPLPSAAVTTVYQDRFGFIWMGIYSSGVARYDGVGLELYTTADGLNDLGVWDIVEDSLGRLWIGSAGGLVVSEQPLVVYSEGLPRPVRFSGQIGTTALPAAAIDKNALAIDDGGWLWVSMAEGIVRYQANDLNTTVVDTVYVRAGEEGPRPTALTARRDGTVWAGLSNGGLLIFHPGRDEPDTLHAVSELTARISVLYEAPDRTLWGGTTRGDLFWLDEQHDRPRVVVADERLDGKILGITTTADSTLWIVSEGGGALKLDGAAYGQAQRLTREQGLLSETLHHVMQDMEGNLWFAQLGGVSRLKADYRAYRNYTARSKRGETPTLPDPSVGAVALTPRRDHPCAVWAGGAGGVACITGEGRSAYVQTQHGLHSNYVNALAPGDEGDLWIGSAGGIDRLSLDAPSSGRDYPVALFGTGAWLSPSWSFPIFSISRTPLITDGRGAKRAEALWFGSDPYLLLLVASQWYIFSADTGLPPGRFHSVATDDEGHVWVATQNHGVYRSTEALSQAGLTRLEGRDVVQEVEGRSLTARVITTSLFEPVWPAAQAGVQEELGEMNELLWHDGVMWVTTDGGVVALQPIAREASASGRSASGTPSGSTSVHQVAHLTEADGLGADLSASIALSPPTQTLWVGTNHGLAEIDPASRTVRRVVTKREGLVDNEVWYLGSVEVAEDGTVLFGTANGLALYEPALDTENDVAPMLTLRAVSYAEEFDHNEFVAEYAALSFSDEKQVRYKTRLVGYDRNWSEVKEDTKIRYTNLPAFFAVRDYTLEVLAQNDDGVWSSSPLRYTFRVRPPPFWRWWAVTLYLGLLVGAIVVAARYGRARIVRREREKAQLREAELRAVAREAEAKVLVAENERQTQELEAARKLQLSLLPRQVPQMPEMDMAAFMQTATEVGGDYYDWHLSDDGTLTFAIGDATGHGTKAGTVVTAVKGLFMHLAEEEDLQVMLEKMSEALRRMLLPKLYMAIAFGRLQGRTLEVVGAGLPPALLYRSASDTLENVSLSGMPLGGLTGYPYRTVLVDLEPGDVVLIMTDGFPELFDAEGRMLGYEQSSVSFKKAVAASPLPDAIIAHLMAEGMSWMDGHIQDDDITFMVLRAKADVDEPVPSDGPSQHTIIGSA